ncbi:MAG: DNA translocase FtsK [Campylobacteraceae bacterium]|nr:DNA translocase FtsK [Campylobacteraceae bacterium]
MVNEAVFVGTFGRELGNLNRYLFGYISFVYPFLSIIPLFLIYHFKKIGSRTAEVALAITLLFAAALMVQAIFAKDLLRGEVGFAIVDMLHTLIGTFGAWVFVVMVSTLSVVILIDESLVSILSWFHNLLPRLSLPKIFKKSKKVSKKKEIEKISQSNFESEIKTNIADIEDEEAPFYVEEAEKTDFEDLESADIDRVAKKPLQIEVINELEENKKLLAEIEKGEQEKLKDYALPPIKFLTNPPKHSSQVSESEIDQKISDLLDKLRRFKIDGDVVRTYTGPVVTTFEFRPAPHVKVSKILTLQDDLAMALKAQTIRIQAPVPGKDVVGIEIPNKHIDTIYLKDIIESEVFQSSLSPLTIALGKDIVGNPFVTDLKRLPHLLIAGTTGSGKSVGINSMLLSLLYRNSPDTLRLLMIDPKMLEFSMYNDIPHLLTPIITQPKQAVTALSNMVVEMERRYQIMSRTKTKSIEGYNKKVKKEGKEQLPYIVVIIDELADLMMNSGKEVEFYIARLAQMARASGIHLIVATQRPSVDVVTGLIKANLPSRISYKVGQKIDSKVILDALGAESLLGRGDMLFTPPSSTGLIRLHAPFASEKEIEAVVEYLKTQRLTQYDQSFLREANEVDGMGESSLKDGEIDELFDEARAIVLNDQKTSISYIQRRLQIGYNRAARIIEQLESMGVLSSPNARGQREIIV